MKIRLFIAIIFLFVSSAGCNEDKTDDLKNVEVESYIRQLETGQFEEMSLPSFTSDDIPALLSYRESDEMIRNFPRNPISSFYFEECRLGIYVLWTIESIRATASGSDRLFMGFPSLNPLLGNRDVLELQPADLDQAHTAAAEAYYRWWYDNEGKAFDEYKSIDPLADTDYLWR